MGRRPSLKQMVLGKLDVHMQKNKVGLLPYTIYKNHLKQDERPKCKALNYETHKIQHGFNDTEFGNDFSDMTPRSQATKVKTNN